MPRYRLTLRHLHLPRCNHTNTPQFTDQMVLFRALVADTDGAFSLFECRIAPQQGALPHLEHNVDEAFFVLEGMFVVQVEEHQHHLGRGDFAFVPKLIPHSFLNSGTEEGRLLIMTLPGRFHERFFTEIGESVNDLKGPLPTAPPDVAKIIAAAQRYGIEVLPPSS